MFLFYSFCSKDCLLRRGHNKIQIKSWRQNLLFYSRCHRTLKCLLLDVPFLPGTEWVDGWLAGWLNVYMEWRATNLKPTKNKNIALLATIMGSWWYMNWIPLLLHFFVVLTNVIRKWKQQNNLIFSVLKTFYYGTISSDANLFISDDFAVEQVVWLH